MPHVAELLTIAKRIQRHHPATKRKTPFKRFERTQEQYDGRHGYTHTGAEKLDQSVRNNIAELLWERKGQKGPAVLRRERETAEREAANRAGGIPERAMASLL
ncbi:MAG: hypothetical protein AAB573_03805 [Patescibacteria group bacterium]